MSESDSLGTSASSQDAADAFSALLLASVARPIPQPFGDPYGMAPVVVGSFGLAPTPPPINEQLLKCPLCLEPFREPKVLACFHSFCKPCLERQLDSNEKVVCPQCNMETQLSMQLGLDSLLTDYGLESVLARQMSAAGEDKGLIFGSPSSTSSSPPLSDSPIDQNSNRRASCTGCKSQERASAFCSDCSHFLCSNCTMAHQYMHCFEGHRVEELSARCPSPPSSASQMQASVCKCLQHRTQPLRFFCLSCNLAICRECTLTEHTAPLHQYEPISEVADKQMATMEALVDDARNKKAELLGMFKLVDAAQQRLNTSAERAHRLLDEGVHHLVRLIDEQRKNIAKEIDAAYSSKHLQLTMVDKRIQQMSEKLSQTIEFTSRLVKNARPTEVMVFKQLLDTRLRIFLEFNPDVSNVLSSTCEIEALPLNTQTARAQIASLLGQGRLTNGVDAWGGTMGQGLAAQVALSSAHTGMPPTPIGRPPSRQFMRSPQGLPFSDSLLRATGGKEFAFSAPDSLASTFSAAQYEKWSAGQEGLPLGMPDPASFHLGDGLGESPELSDCASTIVEKAAAVSALYPPRSQIKRQKMIYHCKVFDKEGRFKFQFGECGKRDGQLLYPNRVAVNKLTGDFVVTERSPTHQIQVYNQYGQFLRKFGANILQHPRGVCVDSKGRIIVIECKVMRVLIFDMYGNVQQKFSCSRYLEFPNGVCTNERGEILISDNRAHCIKVFNYEGTFLRQIGGEGITNYPIGVGINSHGEVVVADNHNNFNLTVFSQDGTMIGALESKVKHAQCFDVALVDDGSVVLASKDYRLYLYRFQAGLS